MPNSRPSVLTKRKRVQVKKFSNIPFFLDRVWSRIPCSTVAEVAIPFRIQTVESPEIACNVTPYDGITTTSS